MVDNCSICDKKLKESEFEVCKDCEHRYGLETEVSHEQMRGKKKRKKDTK